MGKQPDLFSKFCPAGTEDPVEAWVARLEASRLNCTTKLFGHTLAWACLQRGNPVRWKHEFWTALNLSRSKPSHEQRMRDVIDALTRDGFVRQILGANCPWTTFPAEQAKHIVGFHLNLGGRHE